MKNYIYCFYDNTKTLLYVGKTTNLENRLKNHFYFNEHYSWKQNIDKYNIVIHECKTQSDLDIYETYFINKYKPIHNIEKVFNDSPSFELPYLESKIYEYKERTMSFANMLRKYIEIVEKEIKTSEDLDIIEEINQIDITVKETIDILGIKAINSCKFNESKIKELLHFKSDFIKQRVKDILYLEYKSGDIITAKEAKQKLQYIYNQLGINVTAKAVDVIKFLPAIISNTRKCRHIKFL